ncbi:unnamed protein product, partial [Scytosiphon promiscuus]
PPPLPGPSHTHVNAHLLKNAGGLFVPAMRLYFSFVAALLPHCCWVAGFHVGPFASVTTKSTGDDFRRRVSFRQHNQRTAMTPLAMGIEEEEEGTSENQYLSLTKLTREQLLLGGWAALLGSAYLGANQDQRSYRARKRDLFRSIAGGDAAEFRDILEVGVGGNPKVGGFSNLGYYRRGQRVVGIDPTLSGEPSEALERAAARVQKLGVTLSGIGGVAEELPFESGSFDAVVSTLVFCSVRDPAAALREVSRVLRPGGKFLFVEHIHAPEEGLSILGLRQQQDLLDPLQQQLADGCHLTRETGRMIRDSVDGPPSSSRLFSRIERMESVRVKSMWPVSEQVFGVVVK